MSFPGIERLTVGPQNIEAYEGWPATVHDFSREEVLAIRTALGAGRPLLVRGEPGTGKTQLARAAAARLGRHFVSQALDAHSEARDLFWTLDAVRRLSEAQVEAAVAAAERIAPRPSVKKEQPPASDPVLGLRKLLAEDRFVDPGVLWWAFNWDEAADQQVRARGVERRSPAPWMTPGHGTVVLLDEIDKADPVLPNALLEALGVGRFDGPAGRESIAKTGPEPLVIITTNEERDLPYAFMRRCAVLDLELPTNEEKLEELLVKRGRQHAVSWRISGEGTSAESRPVPAPKDDVLKKAARLLIDDRRSYRRQNLPQPGQAEFLDLLRAVCCLEPDDAARKTLLDDLKPFVFDKHARRGAASTDG